MGERWHVDVTGDEILVRDENQLTVCRLSKPDDAECIEAHLATANEIADGPHVRDLLLAFARWQRGELGAANPLAEAEGVLGLTPRPEKEPGTGFACVECGSFDVETEQWVHMNTRQLGNISDGDVFCSTCRETNRTACCIEEPGGPCVEHVHEDCRAHWAETRAKRDAKGGVS